MIVVNVTRRCLILGSSVVMASIFRSLRLARSVDNNPENQVSIIGLNLLKHVAKYVVSLLLVAVFVVAAVYWNEARKEIVFLCGNFHSGVSEGTIIRQLETGNLLRYQREDTPSGQRVVVDSPYNLFVSKCVVDFDEKGNVVAARVE